MESTAVSILRGELDASGGSAPMSSLSVRVKWGQNDLAQLGNFRTFLKKYPEVFKLELNTVHLVTFKSASAEAAGDAEPEEADDPGAAAPEPDPAPAATALSKAAAPAGLSKAAAAGAVGVSKAAAGVVPALSKAAAAVAAGKGSKAGAMVAPKGRAPELVPPRKRALEAEAGEAKAARLQGEPGPGKGKGGDGKGGLGSSKAAVNAPTQSKSGLVGAPVKPKSLAPTAPVKAASGQPPEAVADEAADGRSEDVMGSTSFVPKGGIARATVVPKKPGGPALVPPGLSKQGPRGPLQPPSKALAEAPSALAKSALLRAPKGPPPLEPGVALTASQAKRPAPQRAKRPWQEDGLDGEELARTISGCKAYGIELELHALAKRMAPSDEHRRACQRCVALLRSAVAAHWGPKRGAAAAVPVSEVCGAFAQGTELDGSDVDVALFVEGEPGAVLQELRERLQQPPQGSFLEVGGLAQEFPHASGSLAVTLRGSPRATAQVLLVERPRGERLDVAVKRLCDAFEPSRDLVRLVKLWVVSHGLASPQEGHLGGAAWALLALCFLQREGLVPLLGEPAPACPAPPRLSALLRGFFEFLAARERPTRLSLAAKERPWAQGLFLEDPTAPGENLAASLGERQWAQAVEEARRAVERLTARPQRWFHWAEVFDPRELPPERLQRLGPLAEDGDAGTPGKGKGGRAC